MIADNANQPQFIMGMLMMAHQKNEVVSDVVVPKIKPGDIKVSSTLPLSGNTTDNPGNGAVIKDILTDRRDSMFAVNEADSVDNKDAAAATGNPVDNIQARVVTLNNTGKPSVGAAYEEPLDPVIRKYAEIINVDPHNIDNYPLYRFIDQWYGTHYKWGGEDNAGIDCSALSQKLYSKVYGMELLRTTKQQHKNCEKLNSDEAMEGDLIFFRVHRLRVSHVGVYLSNGYFVHASRSQGVVISNLSSKYWHRRYAGCGRVEKEDKSVYESDIVQ